MSALALVAGLALGVALLLGSAHAGRNRLLRARLPRLVEQLEARLGGQVEAGQVALDPRLVLVLAGTRLTRSGVTLTIAQGRVLGLVAAAVRPATRPVHLSAFEATLELPAAAPLPLAFEGHLASAADGSRVLEGVLSSRANRVDLRLRVAPAGPAAQPSLELEITGQGLGLPHSDAPVLATDLSFTLATRGEGASLRGQGALRLARATLPFLEPLGEALAELGFPPLPLRQELEARADLELDGDSLRLVGVDLPATPAHLTGELSLQVDGTLGGTLRIELDRAYLEAGPLALEAPGVARLPLEVTVSGTSRDPSWRARLAAPVALGHRELRLELEEATVAGAAVPPALHLVSAAAVLHAPAPGGSWLLPLTFEGDAGGAPIQGTLRLRQGFLRPLDGGPPRLPPLSFEGALCLAPGPSVRLEGPLTSELSRLHLNLTHTPEAGGAGSRLHGQVAPADLGGWLSPVPLERLFEGAPLACDLTLAGRGPDLEVGGELFAPRLAGGRGTLAGRYRVRPARFEGELRLEQVHLERLPTDAAGTPGMAPHLEAAVTGAVAVHHDDAGLRLEGPLEFRDGMLHLLEAGSRAAVAQGLGPLEPRLDGPARGQLEVRHGRTRIHGLELAAGPLAARGEVAFGGEAGLEAALRLEVEAGYLRAAAWPVELDPEPPRIPLEVRLGEAPAWSVELAAPVGLRGRASPFEATLEAARLGPAGPELLAGLVRIPGPGGGTWMLPLRFEGAEAPDEGSRIQGTVQLRQGFLQPAAGGPPVVPPAGFVGKLRVGTGGEARLTGLLRLERSRLHLEGRRDRLGDLSGTRLHGQLDLGELTGLLPDGLVLEAPGDSPLTLDMTLHGPPSSPAAQGTATIARLRIEGRGDPGWPALDLGEVALDAAGGAKVVQLRALGATLWGGRAELSGAGNPWLEDGRFEGELRLRGVQVEEIPTDRQGTRGLVEHLEGSLSGEISLRGRGRDLDGLHGRGTLSLASGRFHFLRDAGRGAGLGALRVEGRGPARASLGLARGTLTVEDLEVAIPHARATGQLSVQLLRGAAGRLQGTLEARVASELLARSPLLAFPAAAIDELRVPVHLGGTLGEPAVDADLMAAVERLVGRSVVGRTMKGAMDTLWASLGAEEVRPGRDLDHIFARILDGGPDADELLEELIETGIRPDEIEELLDDFRRRRD